jgi:hypothetical protein
MVKFNLLTTTKTACQGGEDKIMLFKNVFKIINNINNIPSKLKEQKTSVNYIRPFDYNCI